ncbi:hypothetical protein [Ekhidna sp.]|uniref:hypothetical protein n=1 Tax=Ekhidna sp. TaxID=2608089 RepID=UPI003C7BE00E
MRFFLHIALLALCSLLFSQEYHKKFQGDDFIVLTDSTRITGDIRYIKGSQNVAIRPFDESQFTMYESSNVVYFRKLSTFYYSKKIDNNYYFAEPLVFGKFTLYQVGEYYILETPDKSIIIDEKNYKEIFSSIYGDRCGWSYNEQVIKYKRALLSSIVRGYNKSNCFKVQVSPIGVSITPGSFTTTLKRNSSSAFTDDVPLNLTQTSFGIFKEFALHKRASVTAVAEYYSISYDDYRQASMELSLEESFIVVGIVPRFYRGNLFLDAGILSRMLHSSESTITVGTRDSILNNTGRLLGYTLGLGYRIHWQPSAPVFDIIIQTKRLGNKDINYQHTGVSLRIGIN